jgi:hypothetical protein
MKEILLFLNSNNLTSAAVLVLLVFIIWLFNKILKGKILNRFIADSLNIASKGELKRVVDAQKEFDHNCMGHVASTLAIMVANGNYNDDVKKQLKDEILGISHSKEAEDKINRYL